MYKIEKNIPIQDPKARTAKYPWREMEVGDSFVVTDRSTGSMSACGRGETQRRGTKFICRKQDDGSVRIWRVE